MLLKAIKVSYVLVDDLGFAPEIVEQQCVRDGVGLENAQIVGGVADPYVLEPAPFAARRYVLYLTPVNLVSVIAQSQFLVGHFRMFIGTEPFMAVGYRIQYLVQVWVS